MVHEAQCSLYVVPIFSAVLHCIYKEVKRNPLNFEFNYSNGTLFSRANTIQEREHNDEHHGDDGVYSLVAVSIILRRKGRCLVELVEFTNAKIRNLPMSIQFTIIHCFVETKKNNWSMMVKLLEVIGFIQNQSRTLSE